MSKRMLQMHKNDLKKEKELKEKEEIRNLLHMKKCQTLEQQAALREKEIVFSSKQKRQAKKLTNANDSGLKKNSIKASSQPATISGFRVILEHLRRDRHCLLCSNITIDSIDSLSLTSECTGNLSSSSGESEEDSHSLHDSNPDSPQTDSRKVPATEEEESVNPVDSAGNFLLAIVCDGSINNNDDVISFTLVAQNTQEKQKIVLSLPRFYFPEGLTKRYIDEKLQAAAGRVFADDDPNVHSMSVVSNKVSVGQQEGVKLSRALSVGNRNKHQEAHLHQIAQMKAVERDKDVRQWKRILHTTGAAREKSQDLVQLAVRDVAILNKEIKGKSTHKSYKGLHAKKEEPDVVD